MIYVALGANMDATFEGQPTPPHRSFHKAIDVLRTRGVHTNTVSSLWKSPAWPDPSAQPPYLNAVIEIETKLAPQKLLQVLKTVEREFGRKPSVRNAPRPLDLDILDYRREVLETRTLILPHPRMCERSFVLFPLQEIASNWADPIKNRTIADWIARLDLADVAPLERLSPVI
ncbi:MAG: 2-amino-4-hydroxy-6-hydroxymethyldihydropteridine diphosphokinase [Robiginitomaculum sp.]|nr:MAG: 2-amino-4-hydroxy-6-hydroxymethyldihydropteridine diphosphokinase [Robiginitomaculum sp.]